MSNFTGYKTKRLCGYSKRHLNRIVEKQTVKDCQDLLKIDDNNEKDKSESSDSSSTDEINNKRLRR